jgi:hypothetical protein
MNTELATYQKAVELAKTEIARLRSELAAAHELIAIVRDSRLRGEDWLEAALTAYDEKVMRDVASAAEPIAERARRVVGSLKRFGGED